MPPRQADAATRSSSDLFRERLDNMLNQRHALYRLADLIEWPVFDKEFGSLYCQDNGSPGKPMRLLVGLQYLKHCYGLSDEAVVSGCVENPYWQCKPPVGLRPGRGAMNSGSRPALPRPTGATSWWAAWPCRATRMTGIP